jgi:chromosome segregation ATPase
MTNEEMETTMRFILEQQAQFATDIGQLRESQARLTEATLANTGAIGRLERIIGTLIEAQVRVDGQVAALAQAQARSEEKIAGLTERLAEVTERLDAFIVVVEKYITKGNSGQPQPD